MNIADYTWDKYCDGECDLLDAHCHVVNVEGIKAICFGLLPSGFKFDMESASGDVEIGLGFHPWAVKESDENELLFFEKYVQKTQLIGEVGLDFSDKHIESQNKQIDIFTKICKLLAKEKGKIVSLHAVKSSAKVMDILHNTKADEDNTIIMHWFSGSSDELNHAIESGYYFSVGPKMLATAKGHEYIRQIPENKLLLETDLPWDGQVISPIDHCNLMNDFAMQIRDLKFEIS